jgi:phosphatidylglycerophosphatase A
LITSFKMVARPNLRFALSHPAHFVALGFGSGLAPFAPGTFGTLLALPIFWWLEPRLKPTDFLILLGGMYVVGVWVCDKTGRDMGVEDHKAIVWDEITAFLIVLFFTPGTLLWQAFAFLLFRLFDIFKPGPIHAIERMFRGGFGVMVDDVVAAFFALICLALMQLLLPSLGGWIGPGAL